jgi:hypothetical protein
LDAKERRLSPPERLSVGSALRLDRFPAPIGQIVDVVVWHLARLTKYELNAPPPPEVDLVTLLDEGEALLFLLVGHDLTAQQ